MEKKVHELLEQSALLTQKGDHQGGAHRADSGGGRRWGQGCRHAAYKQICGRHWAGEGLMKDNVVRGQRVKDAAAASAMLVSLVFNCALHLHALLNIVLQVLKRPWTQRSVSAP